MCIHPHASEYFCLSACLSVCLCNCIRKTQSFVFISSLGGCTRECGGAGKVGQTMQAHTVCVEGQWSSRTNYASIRNQEVSATGNSCTITIDPVCSEQKHRRK
ncbi:unnamed protein product [Ceratitis capitata]|uniref:(Mediterranean fruit fly) hypothetical protein n=1 Tax=Ceratitis capitata TaxID=7213 RepID=A0A811V6H4_CERCA|nr:unnamed protein product [Ceratitis capitata]